MVKNHIKKSWIQIFTKVKSILPCYIPDLPTKFRRNPSTTWDIALYVVFGSVSQLWRITKKISNPDSDLHQNLIISSLSHTQALDKILSKSVHNFEIFCSQTNKKKTLCRVRYLQNSENKFDLNNNWWLNSMTKYATPLQISSQSDKNWQF